MNVARLVVTDGRREMLDAMLSSFDWYCAHNFAQTVIVDDSGDPDYGAWLEDRVSGAHVHHPHRMGLAQAIRSGWETIDAEYVVHLEDDCVFTSTIDLAEWLVPLTRSPHLAQVCLQRGPDSPEEVEAGGILGLYARSAKVRVRMTGGATWTEQDKLFSLQPNVYRGSLTKVGWPEHGGETEFSDKLRALDPDVRFGYLDAPGSPARYVHMGYCRRMAGWTL